MGKTTEVFLPDIGDFHDVEVIELLVKPGDRIAAEDSIATLESDKATMEIPAPVAGVVQAVKVALGQKINVGDLLLLIETDAVEVAPDESAQPPVAAAAPVSPTATASPPAAAPQAAPPATAVPPAVATEVKEIHLPDLGDFHDVSVIEVMVEPGDRIAAEDSMITLESEKATMEIPAPEGGLVRAVKVAVGDKINRGQLLMLLEVPVAGAPTSMDDSVELAPEPAVPTAPRLPPEPAPRAPGEKARQPRPVIARPSDAPRGRAHASPAVRRFARELGVDLMQVPGSAPKSRITKEDVQDFVKRALAGGAAPMPTTVGLPLQLPAAPEVDFSKFGEIEAVALGRIKKLSGAHLHRSWLTVPHVTQFDAADITELEAFRKAQQATADGQGVKLTFMPFLMKAVAAALRQFPQFNASLAPGGEQLILKKYLHLGVAVDTPNGLVVPVLRDVDRKGIFELARELGEVGRRARDGKLSPGDLQGGCLSISSLGGIGGTQFTPIVNAPEVAILGVSRAEMKPVWTGAEFAPRLIMPFSLSYDHRVIDGAEGVRFTTYLAGLLADIRRLLL